ncbi:hypothetical protein BN946_scf184727.g4 [Trametes cinnabarina]|uniref:Cytochrome P450 n=1 Tax=Pycnoporus cinnabarinus TaxID=5643 RepID=A0A060SU71_PYCCI|nr:hypothetical protein BN946_scf184727.g4 [Trametes cinnabarina]
MVIPILAINRDKAIWGEDSFEFRPERWDSLPQAARGVPGIWGHSLTFMGGHHACIGFRFGVNEMKALVFTLLRSLEFKLAVPTLDIVPSPTLLTRPIRASDPESGPQLPVLVRLCSQEE